MHTFESIDISKKFGEVVALKNASVKFYSSKICGLVGANGAGKTTFSKICTGIINPDNGELRIDGEKIIIKSPLDAKKYGIILVQQNLSLVPELTVGENICLGQENRRGKIYNDDEFNTKTASKVLSELDSEINIYEKVLNLNHTDKQIVEISKALYRNPKFLILDEPTASLEYFHVKKLFSKIRQLKNEKLLIIFISHRLWEIVEICDLVHVFRDGEKVGTLDLEKKDIDPNNIVSLMMGKEYIEKDSNKKTIKKYVKEKGPPLLEAKNISFSNKLKDVSFSIKKGEILGIGGLDGQGQEELIMSVMSALKPDKGKFFISGKEVGMKDINFAINLGIFLISGNKEDGLFIDHSVFSNLIIPRFTLKKDRFILNLKKLNKITDEIIKFVSLIPPNKNTIIKNLSGGNQQKVILGRWLQFSSNVLLLSDPAKGVDVQTKNIFYKNIKELADKGTAVVLYASANEELIKNADRVLIMFEGKIIKELLYEEITDDNLIYYSTHL